MFPHIPVNFVTLLVVVVGVLLLLHGSEQQLAKKSGNAMYSGQLQSWHTCKVKWQSEVKLEKMVNRVTRRESYIKTS